MPVLRFLFKNEKKQRPERRTHYTPAAARRRQKNTAPPQTPSRGAGRPKSNQLEMVTTFTYRPTAKEEDKLPELDLRSFLDQWRIVMISFVRFTLVASREINAAWKTLLRRALSTWKELDDAVNGLMRWYWWMWWAEFAKHQMVHNW